MTPEGYRQAQADISSKSEQIVLAVAAASTMSGFTLASALGVFVAGMNQAATSLADAYTSARFGRLPIGLFIPELESERLAAAFATLLDERDPNPLARFGRIAKNEPATAARTALRDALAKRAPEVRMRWIVDPDPCAVCLDLATRTYSIDEVPQSHPYCECTTTPDIEEQETAA